MVSGVHPLGCYNNSDSHTSMSQHAIWFSIHAEHIIGELDCKSPFLKETAYSIPFDKDKFNVQGVERKVQIWNTHISVSQSSILLI